MLLRPDKSSSSNIPITQFFHEWTHHLIDQGYDIADASRGKPSYPKDEDAYNAIKSVFENCGNVFPYGKEAIGEKEYRTRACEGFNKEYKTNFDPSEIIFTTGGQFGIAACFYLIEKHFPNSQIISANPWYVNHHDISRMFRSDSFTAFPVKSESKFCGIDLIDKNNKVQRLSAKMISEKIKKCKNSNQEIGAFLFCNPSNPLGLVTRKNEWVEIAKALKESPKSIIMVDEAFAEVIFDEDFNCSLAESTPELLDRMIILRSGTKALGFPGERLAVMRVPKQYHAEIIAFQSRLMGNAPISHQAGMSAAMHNMTFEKKSKISKYYKESYEYLKSELSKISGIKPIYDAEGGFYSLWDFSSLKGKKIPERAKEILNSDYDHIENDIEIAISLMVGMKEDKIGISTIPASAFGIDRRKMALRISHSPEKAELEKIAQNIEHAF